MREMGKTSGMKKEGEGGGGGVGEHIHILRRVLDNVMWDEALVRVRERC